MRKKVECNCKLPMKLQFFAENGGGAEGDAGGNGGGDGAEKDLSFDDFLKTEKNQAEFDRRIQKAVNTAVSNAQEKWKALTDDKLSEAEKLAKMTKEEKAQYLQTKREKELADREMAIKSADQITIIDVTDAYSVMLTSEAYTFVGGTGGVVAGQSCTTEAVAFCGTNQCANVGVTAADIVCPTGISASVENSGTSKVKITFKTTATVNTACEATIPVVVDQIHNVIAAVS